MEVQVFANAAARDAALPSPQLGQTVVLLDSGDFLIYYGAPLLWAAPWRTAWGEVAAATIPDFSGPFPDNNYGTDMGLAVTLTPVKNRVYVVELEGVMYGPGVSNVQVLIRNGGDPTSWARAWVTVGGYDGQPFRVSRRYVEGSAPVVGRTPVTFDAAYLSLFISGVSAGTDPKTPTRLTVTDVGPSGNAPIA